MFMLYMSDIFTVMCYPNIIYYQGHVIDIGQRGSMLVSSVMEETGGLGVDVVIDNGGKNSTS